MKIWVVGLLLGSRVAVGAFDMDHLEAREKINSRIMAIEAVVPEVGSVEEVTVGGVPLRIYLPVGEVKGEVLLIHGGAWVAGNLETHDNLARYLCRNASVRVTSVGYTLAPEGKFPQQLDECWDVLEGMGDRVVVVGDSAGGNMAAALCLMARDRGVDKIAMQVLINPAPDLSCEGTIEPQGEPIDVQRWQARLYVREAAEVYQGYVSPGLAEDLRGLPPALVVVAEHDELRGDGERFAQRLAVAGVPTEVYCQEGAKHLAGDGARASNIARESLDVAVSAIRRTFEE